MGSLFLRLTIAASLVLWVTACTRADDPGGSSTVVQAGKPPPKTTVDGGGDECANGVHICTIVDAYKKCGVKKNKPVVPTNPARNVTCCCHSDTCPAACCETGLTSTGELDAAMTLDADGNVVVLDQALYDRINADIMACNARGNLGGVDMVPKCAILDAADQPVCPEGGATDGVPPEELCHPEQCDGAAGNPWCDHLKYDSCGPDIPCLCEEDPVQ
jgi:hypothetical protein